MNGDWFQPAVLVPTLLITLLGGISKGAVGFGFPLVSVPLLSMVVGPKIAVPMLIPAVIVANLLLLIRRPVGFAIVRRVLPILLTLVPTTMAGSVLLSTISPKVLSLIVGVVAIGFAASSLARIELVIPPRSELPASLAIGAMAGLLNGSTGIPGPMLVSYLAGLKLEKWAFVYGITVLFMVGNTVQFFSYVQLGLFGGGLLLFSLALIPAALAGQQIGFQIHDRLDREKFRRAVVTAVALSGMHLLARGFGLF